MLKLIRAFLTAGVLEGGLVMAVDEGTPQGGPLSPLLSNIVLDELDQELARRGLDPRISRRDPQLFAHWQMGMRRGSMAGAV